MERSETDFLEWSEKRSSLRKKWSVPKSGTFSDVVFLKLSSSPNCLQVTALLAQPEGQPRGKWRRRRDSSGQGVLLHSGVPIK